VAKREHITLRGDGKAWVVAFRQAENKDYPRVYKSFNFDKYYGETPEQRKRAAWEAARLFEAQETAKQTRGLTTNPTPKVTFEEAANRWHAHGVAKGWRTSTANDYRSALDSRLIREFGNVQLAKLTEQRIEVWLEALRKQVSARTVQKLLFVGGAVFQRAHHDHPGFTANPFRELERDIKPERARIEVYNDEEAWAIVRAAEDEQDAAIFLLAWRAGLRRGEIPPLIVRDVDFVGRTIRIQDNFVRGAVTSPKGKRERHVPLNRSVARALEKLLRERGDPPGNELLFPGEDGGLLDPDALSYRFKAAARKAGVRELRFHDLRHTYCSHLAADGVDPWKIQEWAGHKSVTTTQLYVDLFGPKKEHADRVDAAFGEPAETGEEEAPTNGEEQERLAELIRALTPEQLAEALTQALTRQGNI
jgi:integrase